MKADSAVKTVKAAVQVKKLMNSLSENV